MAPRGRAEKLSAALRNNKCARVEKLIVNGADVNQADAEGTKPLQNAAESGCMQCLTVLLNHGAGIGATVSMDAPSAVSIAAANGHVDALKYLLDRCTDESVINGEREEQSPLHYACYYGEIDALCYIIEKYPHFVHLSASADINYCTSLHTAAENGDVKCIEVLFQHDADIDAVDADGTAALTYAVSSGKLAAVQFLYDCGASAITANRSDWLPLHNAYSNGYVEVARFLLQQYPDTVNLSTAKEHGCWTPLHMAASIDCVDIIELLLQHGANIEAVKSDGRTSLHIAVANGRLHVVKCLLEKRAQGTATSNKGRLPLHDACSKGHVDMVRLLLKRYPNTVNWTTTEEHGCWTPLHMAAESGSVDCIELLLQHGANIEAATSGGSTPLHTAVANGRLHVVKCLLEKGVRGRATNDKGHLSLHYACRNGDVDMVRFLLEQYPDTVDSASAEEYGCWTPLHIAAENDNIDCIELLMQHGANIEATMSDGETALSTAASTGQLLVVKCLLEKGAQGAANGNKG